MTIGGIVPVMPLLHFSVTFVLGGKPLPVTIATIPGRPTGGLISTLAFDAEPWRAVVSGGLSPLWATWSSATRSPLPPGANVIVIGQDSPRPSVRLSQPLKAIVKSAAAAPVRVTAPTWSAPQPPFVTIAAIGGPASPSARAPKSTGFGAIVGTGGSSRRKMSANWLASLRTRFGEFEANATYRPLPPTVGETFTRPAGPPPRASEIRIVSPLTRSFA